MPTPEGTAERESGATKAAELKQAALEYHEFPTPGKLAVQPTKQMVNQRDLALAYSPGVAFACEAIADDPANAFRYTARGNLVAVVSNGTAAEHGEADRRWDEEQRAPRDHRAAA